MIVQIGDQGDAVATIQRMLLFLGFRGFDPMDGLGFRALTPDGVFGPITESTVELFQENEGIYVDGRVGPVTMHRLQTAHHQRQLELNAGGAEFSLSTPAAVPTRLRLVAVPADKWGDGYARGSLRSDAAEAYHQVYNEVHRRGGLLTSSGMIRSLDASVGPNRSATSLHYLGRALDLFIWSGMGDPKKDPYVVERLAPRQYRIWARCDPAKAADGAVPAARQVRNIATYKDRVGGVTVKDHFLDLTELFEKNGFKPIRARATFEKGGSPIGAEWWHFQWEEGLIPGFTKFGNELLRIYAKNVAEKYPPWAHRDALWKQHWS